MNLPSIKFSLGLRGGGGFFSSPRRQRGRIKKGSSLRREEGKKWKQREGLKRLSTAAGRGGGRGHKERGDQERSPSLLISGGEGVQGEVAEARGRGIGGG